MGRAKRKGVCKKVLEGELTIFRAAALKGELAALLAECPELELDLGGITEVDTAGIQLLLATKREAARLGATMRITGHSAPVVEALDLYDLAAAFGDPMVLSA